MNNLTAEELNNQKRKAVESENRLRETFSNHKNMNLGFIESTNRLFKPITKNLEDVKTGISSVKQEIHDKPVPNIEKINILAPGSKYGGIPLPDEVLNKPPPPYTPKVFEDSIFGLHQENNFDKDEYVFGAIFYLNKGLKGEHLERGKTDPHRIFM